MINHGKLWPMVSYGWAYGWIHGSFVFIYGAIMIQREDDRQDEKDDFSSKVLHLDMIYRAVISGAYFWLQ